MLSAQRQSMHRRKSSSFRYRRMEMRILKPRWRRCMIRRVRICIWRGALSFFFFWMGACFLRAVFFASFSLGCFICVVFFGLVYSCRFFESGSSGRFLCAVSFVLFYSCCFLCLVFFVPFYSCCFLWAVFFGSFSLGCSLGRFIRIVFFVLFSSSCSLPPSLFVSSFFLFLCLVPFLRLCLFLPGVLALLTLFFCLVTPGYH